MEFKEAAEMTPTDFDGEDEYLKIERSYVEKEWKKVSNWILPGRGIYQLYSKPQERTYTNPKILDDTGGEALTDLVAILQGGMTSKAKPWFAMQYTDDRLNKHHQLASWLEQCQKLMYEAYSYADFYGTMDSFYTEYGGFNTSCLYMGQDGDPFRFEQPTVGEYTFELDTRKRVAKVFRTTFMTARNIVQDFGKNNVSTQVKTAFANTPEQYFPVKHVVYPGQFMAKPLLSAYYEVSTSDNRASANLDDQFLERQGFFEMPYIIGTWSTIGSDIYGTGPGIKCINLIKRLQQIEGATSMAAHKAVDPPMNVPASMAGQYSSLPGGVNYTASPNEKAEPSHNVRYDFSGVGFIGQNIRDQIKKKFYNDILLTAQRDPNLSPLKATEAAIRENESLLRAGPVVGRTEYSVLQPVVERGFNIMFRKGLFPPLDPALMQEVAKLGLSVKFVSVLSQAQKSVLVRPLNTFLNVLSATSQFYPQVKDKVNPDRLIDEYADLLILPKTVQNDEGEIKAIRAQRQKDLAEEKKKRNRALAMQASGEELNQQKTQAEIAATTAEAGVDAQEVIQQIG